MPEATSLLSVSEMAALEAMTLRSRSRSASRQPGRRAGIGTGSSVEFADYRPYHPGDDLRYVDWNLYGRLGRLFLRVYQADAELTLYILLDSSRSMAFGQSAKFRFASRLAAALAVAGVSASDRVRVVTFSDGVDRLFPATRDRAHLSGVFRLIEQIEPAGRSRLNRSIREFGEAVTGSGLVVVLSDCFDSEGLADGLRYLSRRRFETHLIQILADEEVDPGSAFDRVVDAEDPTREPVDVSPAQRDRYISRMREFTRTLERDAHASGASFLELRSSFAFDRWIRLLSERGVWNA
jgi:uncharacterized protein (DUF58 family)